MDPQWRCKPEQLTQEDQRMMAEILAARAADPDGPPATRAAVIRAGVRMVHKIECEEDDQQ